MDRKILMGDKYSRNRENGDTLFSFMDAVTRETGMASGIIPVYRKGFPIIMRGTWRPVSKEEAEGMTRNAKARELLAGTGLFRLSDSMADVSNVHEWMLVEGHTQKEADMVANAGLVDTDLASPAMVDKLVGAGLPFKEAMRVSVPLQKGNTEARVFRRFNDLGIEITPAQVENLWELMGIDSVRELESSPYIVGRKTGLSFLQQDKLGKKKGVDPTERQRMRSLAMEALRSADEDGHTYLFADELAAHCTQVQTAFNWNVGKETIISYVNGLNGYEVVEESEDFGGVPVAISCRRVEAEKSVAGHVKRLYSSRKENPLTPELISRVQTGMGMRFAKQQRFSVQLLGGSGVKVLTGGPGTGKTTTLKMILNVYSAMYPNAKIALCAPTGRAAQRMAESTGMPAQTVHKLCDYRPFGEGGATHKGGQDMIDADIVVCDESSMLDIEIAAMLLGACKDGTTVIFVGDINQLQSVGPGNFLHDLIESRKVPVVHLTEVFRQAQDSPIIANGTRILSGDMGLELTDDFRVITCKTPEEVRERTMGLLREAYDRANPFATQVLSPTHRGVGGVRDINLEALELFNRGYNGNVFRQGGFVYHVGDKILMFQNNYAMGYCNGDTGTVTEISGDRVTVDLAGEGVFTLNRENAANMLPAYNMTIHKSQGCEYPLTILSLTNQAPQMLYQNLLYTGITRAKKEAVIIEEEGALARCIKTRSTMRRTFLTRELVQEFTGVRFGMSEIMCGCM